MQPTQGAAAPTDDERVAAVKASVAEELKKASLEPDTDVRLVSGVYVGLYVLPSESSLNVGFGLTGGRRLYSGPDSGFDAKAAAASVAAYVGGQAGPPSNIRQ